LDGNPSAGRRNSESVSGVSPLQGHPDRHAVTLGKDIFHANLCMGNASPNVRREGLELRGPVHVRFRISQPVRHTLGREHFIYATLASLIPDLFKPATHDRLILFAHSHLRVQNLSWTTSRSWLAAVRSLLIRCRGAETDAGKAVLRRHKNLVCRRMLSRIADHLQHHFPLLRQP